MKSQADSRHCNDGKIVRDKSFSSVDEAKNFTCTLAKSDDRDKSGVSGKNQKRISHMTKTPNRM